MLAGGALSTALRRNSSSADLSDLGVRNSPFPSHVWSRQRTTRCAACVTAANVADQQSRDPFGCMHLTPDKLQNSQV